MVRGSRLVFRDQLGGIVLLQRGGRNQVLLRARVVAGNFSLQLGNDILAASRLCLPGGNNEASSFGGVEVARRWRIGAYLEEMAWAADCSLWYFAAAVCSFDVHAAAAVDAAEAASLAAFSACRAALGLSSIISCASSS